jgi:hypothetical protein
MSQAVGVILTTNNRLFVAADDDARDSPTSLRSKHTRQDKKEPTLPSITGHDAHAQARRTLPAIPGHDAHAQARRKDPSLRNVEPFSVFPTLPAKTSSKPRLFREMDGEDLEEYRLPSDVDSDVDSDMDSDDDPEPLPSAAGILVPDSNLTTHLKCIRYGCVCFVIFIFIVSLKFTVFKDDVITEGV